MRAMAFIFGLFVLFVGLMCYLLRADFSEHSTLTADPDTIIVINHFRVAGLDGANSYSYRIVRGGQDVSWPLGFYTAPWEHEPEFAIIGKGPCIGVVDVKGDPHRLLILWDRDTRVTWPSVGPDVTINEVREERQRLFDTFTEANPDKTFELNDW